MSINKVIAQAWSDPAFKDKLIKEPRAALAAHGVDVPAGTTVKVVENTADTQHLVLPAAPDRASEIAMSELEEVAGGLGPNFSVGCGS